MELIDIALHTEECLFCASAHGPMGVCIMTRNWKVSLLVASTLVVLWTTSADACCRRRRACNQCYYQSGCNYGSTGYYSSGQGGYVTGGGGYYGGGYQRSGIPEPGYARARVRPARGYDYGRPGYNPGGLGGPASGIGVRPGMGAGGFGPGALTVCSRPEAMIDLR